MDLNTTGAAPLESPFGEIPAGPPSAAQAPAPRGKGDRVTLAALENRRLFEVRDEGGGQALADELSSPLDQAKSVQLVGDILLAQLRPGYWFAAARASHPPRSLIAAAASSGGLTTVTDVTHGRGCLLLFGPRSIDVLARLCGLDFGERAFPHAHSAQTSLAKVKALIIRWDLSRQPAYFLCVDRSVARYVRGAVVLEMEAFDPVILQAGTAVRDWPAAIPVDTV